MADRKVIISLLTKMGVENASMIRQERALVKLRKRLAKAGPPSEVTKEELALIKELGANPDPKPAPDPAPEVETDETDETEVEDEKAVRKAEKAASGKPQKAASGKPQKGGKPADHEKGRPAGAMQAFRDAFKKRKSYERSELIEVVTATGVANWTVNNYISLAKGEKSPFGFRLEERRDGGKRTLRITE